MFFVKRVTRVLFLDFGAPAGRAAITGEFKSFMLEQLLLNVSWAFSLPFLPFYYHLPESLWLGLSLDKIAGVFETYGVYLTGLGFTYYHVFYRNVFFKPFITKVSQGQTFAKLRLTVKTTFQSLNSNIVSIKATVTRFFK